jgi:hypothetical protein
MENEALWLRANRYSRREWPGAAAAGNSGSHARAPGVRQSGLHIEEARTERSPDRRRNRLPGLTADTRSLPPGSQPGSVTSPIAPEARDCFQVGPGLPPKWPYRRTPDRSDPLNLRQRRRVFKPQFSMVHSALIADFGLTGHWVRRRRPGLGRFEREPFGHIAGPSCYAVCGPTGGGLPTAHPGKAERKHQVRRPGIRRIGPVCLCSPTGVAMVRGATRR